MLSHLAFVCNKEGRACPLYALGCGEVHSAGSADPAVHLKLLMKARLSEICEVSLQLMVNCLFILCITK